jgi:hypothetical protein
METRYFNQNWQPLRFYNTLSEKISTRHAALKYYNVVPLIVSRTNLIPFQLFKAVTTTGDWLQSALGIKIYIVNSLTGVIRDVSSNLTKQYGQRQIATGDYEMYVVYPGLSEITPLAQGTFYIHAVLGEGNGNEYHWYSDDFKSGFFNTVTFSYKNKDSFGNLWMKDFYWKATYRGVTHDEGEYEEFQNTYYDKDQKPKHTYWRKDKIKVCSLLLDSNALDTLNNAMLCDEVYITDELGLMWPVRITEVAPTPIGESYYHNAKVKFIIKSDSIITVNKQAITLVATQIGSPTEDLPVAIESGTLTFDNKDLTFDGNDLTFNEQQ